MCCADKRWAGCATAQRVLCDEPAAAERSDRRSARASWRRSGSACGCLVRRPDRRCFRHSRNSPLLQRLFVGTNTGLIHVFAWPSSAEATKLSEFQVGSLNMRRRWSKCATANMRHAQCHATCNIMCCGTCNNAPMQRATCIAQQHCFSGGHKARRLSGRLLHNRDRNSLLFADRSSVPCTWCTYVLDSPLRSAGAQIARVATGDVTRSDDVGDDVI